MINAGTKDKSKRSYSDVTKDNKKENIMIVKPKTQQDSKETEKIIKAKVDIKNMNIGVTKFRTGATTIQSFWAVMKARTSKG